jgi:hypothetical protein
MKIAILLSDLGQAQFTNGPWLPAIIHKWTLLQTYLCIGSPEISSPFQYRFLERIKIINAQLQIFCRLGPHLCTSSLHESQNNMCCVCLFILENEINNSFQVSNLSAYTYIKPKWAPNISCADEIRERGGDDCSMEQCHAKRIQSVTATSLCLYC